MFLLSPTGQSTKAEKSGNGFISPTTTKGLSKPLEELNISKTCCLFVFLHGAFGCPSYRPKVEMCGRVESDWPLLYYPIIRPMRLTTGKHLTFKQGLDRLVKLDRTSSNQIIIS